MGGTTAALTAENVRKRYGRADALAGIDLTVPEGTVCGLLGPNGAGKTTAVRIFATLLRADAGRVTVAGHDVAADAARVRRCVGLAGQTPAVDEILDGRENLVMWGRLHHLTPAAARRRADELLDRFGLAEAGRKRVARYSGGMRRRLDLAASFVRAPRVLFLDEPTTGLDPRNRNEVWAAIRDLVAGGTTVLLTTQYLEEADRLAGQIVVLDRGRVIADDSPARLKSAVGGDRVEVVLCDPSDLAAATGVVARTTGAAPDVDAGELRVSAPVRDRIAALTAVLSGLADADVRVADAALRRPTLDEVFLRLTGHQAAEAA
ncbi:daunorubicin resistance protein DrrA family ABC transporter ATP-binding protein [Actinomadura flavalba]|uniref:daunorubicin resistance protein DrrA family ABC transporter ATP-binding protein n=1 Tax=Actinomadura flavalba TaxID=1120938 RepID=UPI00037163E6|nr:daunorubicin resistance protein DrrA family ABC transporter ATP-binding protein [Actinomadura flavalba]